MRDDGTARPTDAERWKAYPLLLSSAFRLQRGRADYFVEYVRQQLDARFGADLYRSGFRIYTTLDLDMQLAAERALEAQLETIEGGADGKFTAPDLPRLTSDSEGENPETASTARRPTCRDWS